MNQAIPNELFYFTDLPERGGTYFVIAQETDGNKFRLVAEWFAGSWMVDREGEYEIVGYYD